MLGVPSMFAIYTIQCIKDIELVDKTKFSYEINNKLM